jgi:hypothetical protein
MLVETINMKDLAGSTYPPVGKCIYCGITKDLRREHIIPYALGSDASLPKATCQDCAKVTSEFERIVLRGTFWPVRSFLNLKSRTKHKNAPKTEPLTISIKQNEQKIEYPLDKAPILLPLPLFTLPGYLDPVGYTHGIRLSGQATIIFGSNPEKTSKELGADRIRITKEFNPVAFARMIAKIAYSMAYAEGNLNLLIEKPKIISSILGIQDDIGFWVGTSPTLIEENSKLLHRISFIEDFRSGLLFSEVQLFADSQAPSYLVVLGELKKSIY